MAPSPTQVDAPLAGLGVLVTRPRDQAAGLMARIAGLGGHPVFFPALEIGPPPDPAAFHHQVDSLGVGDLAIFISPTAVAQTWPVILARRGGWPGAAPVAVGPGTARALAECGLADILAPGDAGGSEGLLALPEMQDMAGRRVVIFRGEGGRELLAETLALRGARVTYAECYRRRLPDQDPAPLLALWRAGGIQAVTLTSSEALDNLFAQLGPEGDALLRSTPLLASHPRIAEAARRRGVVTVIETAAGDAGLLAALLDLAHAPVSHS